MKDDQFSPEDDTPAMIEARREFRAIRKEAGLNIDPETAEVDWIWAQTLDPYGLGPKLPPECDQVGREYFARSPGSDIWVSFDDLPDETSGGPCGKSIGGQRSTAEANTNGACDLKSASTL